MSRTELPPVFASATPRAVAWMGADARASFLMRTYAHLLGAIALFVLLEAAIFTTTLPASMLEFLAGGRGTWLLFLGGFMLVAWAASRLAMTASSRPLEYAALLGFVAAEALLFVPLLAIANLQAPGAISSAAVVSLAGFAGLTAVVFFTRKDFSFLRGILGLAGVAALLLIVGGIGFGFHLGTWFSVGMVVFACGAILYDTSNVLHRYPEDRHVGAALALFASVALLFWYVLRIFLSRR